MKSWKKPTNEMVEKALSSIKKETDRKYFFSRLQNPLWIQPLVERDYFQCPPKIRDLPDGSVQFPFWPELQYLKNVSDYEPDKVINIVLQLPRVDNPRVYDEILDIALKLQGNQSARLKPKILEYAKIKHQFQAYRYAELLAHWTEQDQTLAALELSKMLVEFAPDPQSEEKLKRQRKNPDDLRTLLESAPRFECWEYGEIMEKGLRPLADKEPYQVACMLIKATANVIQFEAHQENPNKSGEEDFSEIWCPRVDSVYREDQDSKETLVHTLNFACEMVFEKLPQLVGILDKALRQNRWKLFVRLRQHLYALHPSEQTKPWIRKLVLAHDDYGKWEHHYEFQRMIRLACERFGAELLTEDERTRIFDAIRSGPSKADFRERMGEQFTEELFAQYQRGFHRMQFKPFASVLFGEFLSYFQELEAEVNKQTGDEDYSIVGEASGEGGIVSHLSPKPPEDLASLSSEELLNYINEWQEEHLDKKTICFVNIEALALAFKTAFRDSIIPDPNRLRFWIENRERIERPIYVRVMIDGMHENVRAQNFDKLNEWLAFCKWLLSHPDQEHQESYSLGRIGGESREHPDWHSSRRAVGDFIGGCLEEDVNVPISFRGQLSRLLDILCTQFDWRLDRNMPTLLNIEAPISEAINNIRSRALEDLVKFGLWVRRCHSKTEVPEVATILEKRFGLDARYPLTLAEYAILGKNYVQIFGINEVWATEHRADFFPKDVLDTWSVAFGNFLHFTNPYKPTFEILVENFDFALQHLSELREQGLPRREPIDSLGQHLFMYYLWDVYPLAGEESLLERYYQETDGDPKRWARLFDYVGRFLQNSGRHLDEALKDRLIEFFECRLEAREPTELQKFTFWLEAECLSAAWRLDAYSRILDLDADTSKDRPIYIELGALRKMLPDHTAMVVKCFARITESRTESDSIYIRTEDAKPIVAAGLESSDESVRQTAERARENLLRLGRFDLLD